MSKLQTNLTLLELLDVLDSKPTEMCKTHSDEAIIYICLTCGDALCGECILPLTRSKHCNHDVHMLENAFKVALRNLDDYSAHNNSNLVQHNGTVDGIKADMLAKLDKRKQKFLKKLDEKCNKIRQEIEEYHADASICGDGELIRQIAEIRKMVLADDTDAFLRIDEIKENVEEMKSEMEANTQRFTECAEDSMRAGLENISIGVQDESDEDSMSTGLECISTMFESDEESDDAFIFFGETDEECLIAGEPDKDILPF